MKAHQTQTTVDRGMVTASDLHGNSQPNEMADQKTAAHGHLEPNVTWTHGANFANKVFHFGKLLGPRLRVRPDSERRG
eukprot:1622143-Amphidinium_carterae.1